MRLLLAFAAVALVAPLGALAGCPPGSAGPSLEQMCPGNLLVNGDFEVSPAAARPPARSGPRARAAARPRTARHRAAVPPPPRARAPAPPPPTHGPVGGPRTSA
jgi:hypothetical protein